MMSVFGIGVVFVIVMIYAFTVLLRCAIFSDWNTWSCARPATMNLLLMGFVVASLGSCWLLGDWVKQSSKKTWLGVVVGILAVVCFAWYWNLAEFEFQQTGITSSEFDDEPSYRR
jgi:drug/metabolite transporter (DMT)-like permease